MNIHIHIKRWTAVLISGVLLLSLIHVMAGVIDLNYDRASDTALRFFNMDAEKSLPTLVNVLLLQVAGVLLLITGIIKMRRAEPFSRFWLILAITFFGLSIDESAAIHEASILPLRTALGVSGVWHFSWVILAIPAVVLFGLVFLRFLVALQPRVSLLFLLAGGLYVGGAIGVEMIGGWVDSSWGRGYAYLILTTVEETMEMLGLIVFIHGILLQMLQDRITVQVSVCQPGGMRPNRSGP